mgnify:CR=1 FL=1
MYELNPYSIRHRDNNGEILLHDAARNNVSADILTFLTDKYPEGMTIQNKQECTALDLAKAGSYKDTNKEIILPVLNKISNRYQQYSGEERNRSLELINISLQDQIDFYKIKSINSLREAQQFAMDQDLTFLANFAELDNEIVNSINIELIRVEAANKIRFIDNQLDKKGWKKYLTD